MVTISGIDSSWTKYTVSCYKQIRERGSWPWTKLGKVKTIEVEENDIKNADAVVVAKEERPGSKTYYTITKGADTRTSCSCFGNDFIQCTHEVDVDSHINSGDENDIEKNAIEEVKDLYYNLSGKDQETAKKILERMEQISTETLSNIAP